MRGGAVKHVAAYVRVSSASQSADMQRAAIEKAARARGDGHVFMYEEKKTAKTLERPVLELVRAEARAGNVTKLYVWRLDRLARSGIRDTLHVVEELRHNGCAIVSVTDGFDLEGPARDVVLAVLAWAAQMEHLAITERLAAARARAREAGKRWGRPPRMTAAEVKRALELHRAGKSIRQLSRTLKIPRPTLTRALSAAAKVAQKSRAIAPPKAGPKRKG
jgi:DNA invertase Pin-like site-specific DNA recombinase